MGKWIFVLLVLLVGFGCAQEKQSSGAGIIGKKVIAQEPEIEKRVAGEAGEVKGSPAEEPQGSLTEESLPESAGELSERLEEAAGRVALGVSAELPEGTQDLGEIVGVVRDQPLEEMEGLSDEAFEETEEPLGEAGDSVRSEIEQQIAESLLDDEVEREVKEALAEETPADETPQAAVEKTAEPAGSWAYSVYDPEKGVMEYYSSEGSLIGTGEAE
ncbi:MAG: hypothetical protein MJA29_07505 [Candidatus Omnitrophica bacterium]|nr:hypothetical protein [Candidatus Omnitrophota bacterium]